MKYKIKQGDTLSQIAQDMGVSIDKIASANAIKDVNKIYAGEILHVPKKQENEEIKTTKKEIKKDEFYTGNIPLAARQYAYDTKYDILRNFLPKRIADKATDWAFDPDAPITKRDMSKDEYELAVTAAKKKLPELLSKGSSVIDYDDWREVGAGGTSTIHDNPFEVFKNPARSLQYTFGQAGLEVDQDGNVYLKDRFNWNDAAEDVTYSGPEFTQEGYLKMGTGLEKLKNWKRNLFRAARNYKTRVGRPEGFGSKSYIKLGNISDWRTAARSKYFGPQEGRGGRVNIGLAHGGQIDMPPKDLERQVQNVADQGRFGDSMLVHMNPQEVQGLAAMSGTGLTTNPQTGQPEAFLPFLAPLLGSWLGGAALTGVGAGGLGGLIGAGGMSAATASAIGSGLATWAESGDIEKGIYGALTGMAAGNLVNNLAGTESAIEDAVTTASEPLAAQAGGTGAGQQLTDYMSGVGVDWTSVPATERLALQSQLTGLDSPTAIDVYATKLGGLDPFKDISPDMMSRIGREGYDKAYKAFDPTTGGFGGASVRENVLAGIDPVTGNPATTIDPTTGAATPTGPFMKNYLDEQSLTSRAWENASPKNVLETGMEYDVMLPLTLGGVGLEQEYFMDAQAAKKEEEERKKKEKYAGLLYGARERPPPSSAYYGTKPRYGAQGGVIRAQAGFGGLPGGMGMGIGALNPTLLGNINPALLKQQYLPKEPLYTVEPVEPVNTTPYIDVNNPNPYAYDEPQPTVSTVSDLPAFTDRPPVTTVPP